MTLSSRLQQIRERVQQACQQNGRDLSQVQLLAVSKTFPADSVAEAYALGLRCFGENYVQEAVDKMALLPHDIEWHCIGPLQSNKAKWVSQHFDWCQSVDSLALAQRLSRLRAGLPPLNICLQLHIGGEHSKSGLSGDELLRAAEAVLRLPHLHLRGLMTIPPPSDDVATQRKWFAQARQLFEQLQTRSAQIDTLSMGMSADLEAAIAEGSTMVRVGSALFGSRAAKAN
jgi:pyridoxal phosphate enzyme (YggS family)